MAESERAAELAASFDRAAKVYARARPSYPVDAVAWLVPDGASTVLDVAAGTGKLTRVLIDLGLSVIAVDPSPNMLGQLALAVPEATRLRGTAESIPLADASVDAVFVAQAWHWVDQDAALTEIARVLRPGGTLGLIWNMRDQRVPWVARLTDVMHRATFEDFLDEEEIRRGSFGPIEAAEFAWSQPFDRDRLVELVRSRSYFITADEQEKQRLLAGLDAFVSTDPDLGGATLWELPYRTLTFRMCRP